MKLVLLFTVLSLSFRGTLSLKGCTKPRLSANVLRVTSVSAKEWSNIPTGFKITTRCSPGYYKTSGHATRTCLNGRWTGYYMVCEEDTRCPDPGVPIGGRKHGTKFFLGYKVEFSCRAGLVLNGSNPLVCTAGKNWSSPIPSCEREISCPEFGELSNAEAKEQKRFALPGYSPDDTITYTCNTGYKIYLYEEKQTIKCLHDGTWNLRKLEKCSPVICDPPRKKAHIEVTPDKDMYEFGDKVVFGCEEGYQTKGHSILTCNEYGAWDTWEPECKVIQCANPGLPDNSRRIGNRFRVGDNVTFVCYEGYTLKGSENRTCLSTRDWSGELTICDLENSDCPDPGIPIGSSKDGNSYNVGDSVTYVCDDEEFLQVGNTTRYCLINGEWSGNDNFCEYKHSYDDPTIAGWRFVENLDVLSLVTSDSVVGGYFRENLTLFEDNSTARSLNLGNRHGLDLYLVMDTSGSIDNESLAISKQFCKEVVNRVGASDKIDGTRVTVITFSGVAKLIVNVADTQTPESINGKIDEIQAQDVGATALSAALKEVLDLVQTRKATVDESSSQAAIIITDGMYNLKGHPKATANELKDLNVDMYAIGIGGEVDKELLQSISKKHQYIRLQTMEDLNEVMFLVFSGEAVDRFSECGVGGLNNVEYQNIDKYQEAQDIKNWPWMAGLYNLRNEKFKFVCGATIINSEWLLSAAHCFDTDEKLKVANWEVRLGSLKRATTKSATMFMKDIIMHPDFTQQPHELNDLVLIRLTREIQFAANIRPICLTNEIDNYAAPDFSGDWYEDDKQVIVTGWGGIKPQDDQGNNEVVLSKILKYIAMPKQSDEKCKESAADEAKQLQYEGIYCAGNGKKLDACQGDSGGPSVREVKLRDGTKRVFQIGVVSFGWGCQQDGLYGFYVKLVDYLPWILSVINPEN